MFKTALYENYILNFAEIKIKVKKKSLICYGHHLETIKGLMDIHNFPEGIT